MARMIEVRDLVKRYKKADRNAVDGVSFEVGAGEFFALLGPNGAGKTTTISILTTTLAPTSGRIRICGYELAKEPSEVRRRVGIIFQNPSLDRNLSGEENVRLHAILDRLHHYLEEAEQADRLCILNHGRIVAMGSPGEVRLSPAEEFLELDATDRAQLRLELKKLNLNFEEDGAFTVRLDGRSAHEVIRSLDVPLTRLRTRQPSLEDAYLKILADE